MQKLDLTGQIYGQWVVLKKGEILPIAKWICECSCGTIKEVRQTTLRQGSSKSCGCIRQKAITKHGGSGTRLYKIWKGMRTRCLNPNIPDAVLYGGKGITICDEWADFTIFRLWAENSGYADDLTIDRKDSNKNYNPDNCRWATYSMQNRNASKQKNSKSKYLGVSYCTNRNTWKPAVTHNKKRIHLGSYKTEFEAAKVRDQYIIDNNLQYYNLN